MLCNNYRIISYRRCKHLTFIFVCPMWVSQVPWPGKAAWGWV